MIFSGFSGFPGRLWFVNHVLCELYRLRYRPVVFELQAVFIDAELEHCNSIIMRAHAHLCILYMHAHTTFNLSIKYVLQNVYYKITKLQITWNLIMHDMTLHGPSYCKRINFRMVLIFGLLDFSSCWPKISTAEKVKLSYEIKRKNSEGRKIVLLKH